MKKILTLLLVIAMAAACKKKEPETSLPMPLASPMQDICEDNTVWRELQEITQQAEVLEWLAEHGHKICAENLYECVARRHVMKKSEYENAVNLHSDNVPYPKEYSLKWKTMADFFTSQSINCYEKYIGFTFNSGSISLKALSYTNAESCYSRPLFEGIKRAHGLTDSSNIVFAKGMIPVSGSSPATTREAVLIKVTSGANTFYYDMTDDPR